jgi:glycerol-3-phosphate dehydrogenase (NAD(P)+)
MQQRKIAVLGAGSWGTALSMVLANNGYGVQLWDRDLSLMETIQKTGNNERYLHNIVLPKSIKGCLTLSEALEGTLESLIVVPSHGFKALLQTMKPLIDKISRDYRIIWATKGLDPEAGEFLDKIVAEELGADRCAAVLSGPSFAKEVALGVPTAVMLAAKDAAFRKEAASFFANKVFSLDLTDDLTGVQLGGVVKNILAVAAGLAEGLGFGANTVAALVTHGLAEMRVLGEAVGAKRETLMGLAGCGDTILTCTDNQSRNRRLGLALASGLTLEAAIEEIGQVVEAIHNVTQIMELLKRYKVTMPIVEQVYRIMKEGAEPRAGILSLFNKASQDA